MSKLRILLAALVVLTVAVALFLAFGPRAPLSASRPAEATGLTLRGYEDGKLAWEAEATRGEIASATSALTGVTLRVFDGTAATLNVTAQELNQETGTITMSGAVRGETKDGVSLSSDTVTWRESEHHLESGPTTLQSGTDELTADSFVYDTSTREASLAQVEGTLYRESALKVSSEHGTISQDEIRLDGAVAIVSGDDTLRSDSLETDLRGTEVALLGSVNVTTPQWNLKADSVRLTKEGDTATGNVKVDVDFAEPGVNHGA